MIQPNDFTRAKDSAEKQVKDVAHSFVQNAVPKLGDSQHTYIATRLINDPALFGEAVKKFGGEAVDKYLRKHVKG